MTSEDIVRRACGKLRSAIRDEAVLRLNFTGDLREMLDMLEVIHPLLEKIGTRQLRDVYVSGWLLDVTQTAYRVMDMVDELQLDARPPAAATMKRMLPFLAIKKNVMATKVEETKKHVIRIKEIYQCFNSYEEFSLSQQQRGITEHTTYPSFEEASIIGRRLDKKRIVAVLLSVASNFTQGPIILPIFGLAGSGKTTLAKMVFNNTDSFIQQYNFRVWVYASSELNFHRIGESILRQVVSGGEDKEEINDQGSNPYVAGMEHIMKRLHELLNGKKVLLILDDLWEEDSIQLQLLKSMLTFLGDKVDVIVTTCNQAIARKICTVVQPYRLNPLGDDTCWEIIKKSICFEEDEVLEKIGWKIASKCRGIPPAALEYSSMLAGSRDPTEWEEIMESNVLYCSTSLRLGALFQTLFLSYRYMPPELRLCFDYNCDIFPNGHNIFKHDLVHQWIALDFIEPSERLSATDIAEGYITRLLDMSFFQTAKSDLASGNDDKGAAMFTMPDMVHGFASWNSSNHYRRVTNCHGELDNLDDDYLRALHCVGCSKVEFNNGSFSRKKCLRVLELKESSVEKLPDSIWQLRHLGYLKISEFSGLVALPESFGDLTNLLHIDLSGCCGLVNLPESFGKLIRLMHVNLSGCSGLATLPGSFGDLMNLSYLSLSCCHGLAAIPEPLQKLGKLVHLDLSFWSCFEGIGEGLGGLTNLERLNLSNPCCHLAQQRFQLQELKDGLCKLTSLSYLNLSMCLNPIFYYKSEEDNLHYIESCVSSLSSLEHLDLSHNTFLFDLPQSLGDLNKLHTLDLSGCIRLKRIGEMKSLKFMALMNCRGLESCNFVVHVDDDNAYSSNIVQLEDVNCQELQISCLEKVRYKEEAQIIKLVEKQKLESLKLSWTLDSLRSVEERALLEDSVLLGELVPPPNLECLEVNNYSGTCLPEYFGELTSLQELKIVRCRQLNSLPASINKLSNLKDLSIFHCPELEKWCQLEENKKTLAHIPNKNYEEHSGTSRPEIEEDDRSISELEAKEGCVDVL
uniref:Uncharacterized protein n=1 Tax=Avena sativa TaxID=4498 RepID=A0ACD5YZH9_AVESA